MILVEFEDKGQDFTQWLLDDKHVVRGAWPFQSDLWTGNICLVLKTSDIQVGKRLRFYSPKTDAVMVLNYAVTSVTELEEL